MKYHVARDLDGMLTVWDGKRLEMKTAIVIAMLAAVCHAQPLEIADYTVVTNYGKFERVKIGHLEVKVDWSNSSHLYNYIVTEGATSTNWTIEATNLPVSLTHTIIYNDTNGNASLQMESVEPLNRPGDWRYCEPNWPVASVWMGKVQVTFGVGLLNINDLCTTNIILAAIPDWYIWDDGTMHVNPEPAKRWWQFIWWGE